MFKVRSGRALIVLYLFLITIVLSACGAQPGTPTPAPSAAPTPDASASIGDPLEGAVEPDSGLKGAVGFAPISPECDQTLTTDTTFEDEVIRLVNEERAKNGNLPPLTKNAQLTLSAQMHTKDMICNIKGLDHTGSNGSNPGDRIIAANYFCCTTWAENIAAGQSTPAAVMNAWMNSPGHRRNILNPTVTEIGVGYFVSPNVQFGRYWTQNFAKPMPGQPPAPTAVPATNVPPTTAPPTAVPPTTAPATELPAATEVPPTAVPATQPPAGGNCATNDPAAESEVIRLINAARAARGLTALTTPAQMATAARTHSNNVACNNRDPNDFDMSLLGDLSVSDFFSATSTNNNNAAQQADSWITDPNADSRVLSPDYTLVGVGYVTKAGGQGYWTVLLATP